MRDQERIRVENGELTFLDWKDAGRRLIVGDEPSASAVNEAVRKNAHHTVRELKDQIRVIPERRKKVTVVKLLRIL